MHRQLPLKCEQSEKVCCCCELCARSRKMLCLVERELNSRAVHACFVV